MSKIQVARDYFKSIESKDLDGLLRCYDPDAVQIELPNLLKKNGDRRTVIELKRDFARGAEILSSESYQILSMTEDHNRVAVEVLWCGTLAIPLRSLQKGDQMKAHSAIVFEFKNDRIAKQTNYDCFEAF